MAIAPDVKMEALTRYLFTAPRWYYSILLTLIAGWSIDLLGFIMKAGNAPAGTCLFSIPAVLAFFLTKPLVIRAGGAMTWNRSALLSLVCMIIAILGTIFSIFWPVPHLFQFLYACALGFILALRTLVLTAVACYRTFRILLPASIQSVAGLLIGYIIFDPSFLLVAFVSCFSLGAGCILLIYLIERPFFRTFDVHVMWFLNAYLAHLTDGSRDLEKFFRQMGQEAVLPQTSVIFRRKDREPVVLTVPNIHPGPMGDIGSTNLPSMMHDAIEGEVLVCHGCASHDYNLVGMEEMERAIAAMRESLRESNPKPNAGRSVRFRHASVSILAQAFGDTILLVATRAPERTEDMVPAIGEIISAEGGKWFGHVAFVDAHNCMREVTTAVHPTQPLGHEYITASSIALKESAGSSRFPFRIGVSHLRLPFTREEGFGPLGLQTMVAEVEGQLTAYVLLDGNNMMEGCREELLAALKDLVDQAEVMTTDTHVVNSISGLNPIGMNVPASALIPHVVKSVREAIADLAPAEAGGTTAICHGLVIFGHERIAQIASTVNTIVIFLVPLSLMILFLAYLISLLTYLLLLS
ncbi:MAG: DUF2070 family protein [Methanomicrobiales archaeon]|nr:DUF2070 family protein [Methanomicrobiales archaeon]